MSERAWPRHLTPTELQRLLERHELAPRRAAGQNFVVDPNTIDRIVAAADLQPGDRVLEVGPGLGSLTGALLDAVTHVTAVEVDAGFVEVLRERFAAAEHLTLVHADVLETDLAALLGDRPARLVANLPYNLATAIVLEALAVPAVADAFVMVQREVGQRWAAGPEDALYGGVSVKMAVAAEVEVAFAVPRTVFMPVPNVDSVMVRLRRRPDAPGVRERQRIRSLVDTAFAHRRKTLRNNLRRRWPEPTVDAALRAAGLDASVRAEALVPGAFVELATALAAAREDGPDAGSGAGPP